MPLCFIEPQDAIRVIAESVGREARRKLLGALVRAWVDEIPDSELETHYVKAVDEDGRFLVWVGERVATQPRAAIPEPLQAPASYTRRELPRALKIAAGFRGEEAFDSGVAEDQALDTVLPHLSRERSLELAAECLDVRDGIASAARTDRLERRRRVRPARPPHSQPVATQARRAAKAQPTASQPAFASPHVAAKQ
jgi:hypothetical protein